MTKIQKNNQVKPTDNARSHPPRFWLWLSLIVIQTIGLALVILATPFISRFAQSVAVPNQPLSRDTLDDLAISSIVIFLILVIGNGLAIQGMWRLYRWPLYYLITKLAIAFILIVAVCLNVADAYLLFFIAPLFCSLSYMVLTYRYLITQKSNLN